MSARRRSPSPRVAPPTASGPRWLGWTPETWGLAAGLVLMVVAVYWPTLRAGFIWDDDMYVEQNSTLTSLAGLGQIWFQLGAIPQYYPLVHTTFWIEYHLWGLDPAGYHAVNLALHALTAVLVWRLLLRLEVPGAYLAAAIFAVHPVAVESVAWITERKNVLSCLLAVASLLVYLRFAAERERQPASPLSRQARLTYAFALLLYLGALFSKTVVASVPAVLLVIAWWRTGRITRRDVLPLVPFFVIGLATSAVTVWMEKTHVGASGSDWGLSPLERLLVAGRAAWFYAGKLLWPWPLVFVYERWEVDSTAWRQYLYPAAVLLLLFVLWTLRHRIGRGPLAAVLIFGGVLVPALGFFDVYPFVFSYVADHFQYHACIAMIALVASALVLAARRQQLPRWSIVGGAALLLLVLGTIAHRQTEVYHDRITLYQDTLAKNPRAWMAHVNLGVLLQQQQRDAEAARHYEAAVEIVPPQRWPRLLGSTLYLTSRLDEAAAQLEAYLNTPLSNPRAGQAHLDLGKVLVMQGRHDEALKHLRLALELRPDDPQVLYSLAEVLRGQKQYEAAAASYRKYLTVYPDNETALAGLSESLLALDRGSDAITLLRAAVERNPRSGDLQRGYASALMAAQQWPAAERQLRAALALNPRDVQALNLLGVVLGSQGNLAAAIESFEAALAIDPQFQPAANNLKSARTAAGKP